MKIRLNKREKRVVLFFVKFNVFAVPLYVLLAVGADFSWLQNAVAGATMELLAAAGISASRDGYLISIPVEGGSWGGFINSDCVGWKSVLAYLALVMATDFPARKKLTGLVLVPVIFIANLARIFFMFFYVNTWGLAGYGFVHAVVWSWGLLIIVIAAWVAWAKWLPETNIY
ncbi:MAG: archaeosortase/exosortase family protein [Candidatus Aenigmarchaeota archaeon]|nr:archaeosortase/exosortase family protein [Candidatus Aenigmarchaeota archaeon]